MVRKSDLFHNKDRQLPGGRGTVLAQQPILYCPDCGAEFSANPADYWQHPANFEFVCTECEDRPMELVYKRTVYEDAL